MYGGFSYASTEYAATRVPTIFGPIVKLLNRTIQSVYGVSYSLMLKFRNTTAAESATASQSIRLKFRSTTLANPTDDSNTLEL